MSMSNRGAHRKIPSSIHLIAILYVVEEALLLSIFYYTRVRVSLSLISADLITILLSLIPLLSIWSIYSPKPYTRWFPLYSILLIWLVVVGIGFGLLQIAWLTDATSKRPFTDADLLVGGSLTLGFVIFLSLWTLFAFLPTRFISSARHYIYGTLPTT